MLLCLSSGAKAADLFALVVGIDRYALQSPQFDLDGAVNDAVDIAATLRRTNAREVVLLTDDKATKAAIEQSWFRLVDSAKAGDTVVLSYAGHGSQEPEPAGRHEEEDGKNENFILGGFLPTGIASKERIVDDEMNAWLNRADTKGVRVVFIADACHSGSMTRALGQVAESRLKFRNMPRSSPEFEIDFPPPQISKMRPDDFKNVTFVAAVQEDKKSPEITIEGKTRGALSYAFARAIEGAGDTNGDGQLNQDELLTFLKLSVNKLVESQQVPEVSPLRSIDRPILPALRSAKKAPERAPTKPALKLAAVGGSAQLSMPGVALVADPADADLVFDVGARTVTHRIGGLVAEGVDPPLLRAVVAKWVALEVLKRASDEVVAAEITTGGEVHKRGQKVGLSIKGAVHPFLTVFNLPPSGRVDYLTPETGKEKADFRGRAMNEDFVVADPPFGAEHIVAILSDEPLVELQANLRGVKTPQDMPALPGILEAGLAGKRIAIGIAPLYTSGASCRRSLEGTRCFREYGN